MDIPGIILSNDQIITYVIASGGLAYDGKGWLWDQPLRWFGQLDEHMFSTVMKTVTLNRCRGNYRWWNPFGCVRFIPGGTVNAFGLTNPGIDWWCEKVGLKITKQLPVIGSILGDPKELAEMAKMLNDYELVALEVNASCPNTGGDILALRNIRNVVAGFEAVRKVSRFPIIGKLSVAHQEINWVVSRCKGLVEAISINSVPWNFAYPDRKSPLAHLGGGGISGKAAQPWTWKLVKELAQMTDTPVIGPSVWDYGDIDRVVELGAKAVSFGAILMPNPYRPLNPLRPTAFVRRHMAENK